MLSTILFNFHQHNAIIIVLLIRGRGLITSETPFIAVIETQPMREYFRNWLIASDSPFSGFGNENRPSDP